MSQQTQPFVQEVTTRVTLYSLLHLPPTINDGSPHPLLLFLHGSGERGTDITLVKKYGPPKIVETQPDFPFILVSPQCPADDQWVFHSADLRSLLDEVCQRYPVDPARIYGTGLSMGGTGIWFMAAHYPDYFAAIAPVCGDGHLQLTQRLTRTPIWAFHGELDDVVLPERSQLLVGATKYLGGDAQLTLYPDLKHNSWDRTYANPDLYTWFLQHHR
ncbi:MAG: dienelactone hydrolase family protein [Anaerolineae bacterium]|nr:dienelactone hydrolase family protein [Anaerolineae bacterium]